MAQSPHPREFSSVRLGILHELARGFSVKEIAFRHELSTKSVESHKYRVMKQLGLRNRVALTRYALRYGLIDEFATVEVDEPDPSVLSNRQTEIVILSAEGLTVREMAVRLGLSAKSVNAHKHQAMYRLDIHDSVRLLHYCVRHGIVQIDRED